MAKERRRIAKSIKKKYEEYRRETSKMPTLLTDPRLLNLDQELLKTSGQQTLMNTEMMFMHLRDSRELLRTSRDRVMAKAAIAVASAALESNLTHLSSIGMGFAEVRPKLYTTPQIIKRRIAFSSEAD